jgi:hypothetical protein
MQKWRPWEAASDTEWGLALEREAVIRPLTEPERLSTAALAVYAIATTQLGKPVLRAEIAGVFGLADRAAVASE